MQCAGDQVSRRGDDRCDMNCAPARTGVPPSATRRGLGGACLFFAVWCLGLTAMLGAMARTGCEPVGVRELAASRVPEEARGWGIRHWLPLQDPVARSVARLLAARGAAAGIRGEIHLIGDAGGLAADLRRGGWWVVERAASTVADTDRAPRLEFSTPGGQLAWRGGYRVEVGPESGGAAVLLDLPVLSRLARGEPVAPFVSVGCAVPLATRERG